MLTIPVRERRYVRNLIALGCPEEKAIELGSLQRKVWEAQASVENSRNELRLGLNQAMREDPRFREGVKVLASKQSGSKALLNSEA